MEKKSRKAEPCHFMFYGTKGNFCRGTTISPCPKNQAECPFYKSELQYKMSLQRARLNFKKRYGYDGYGLVKYTEHYQEDCLKNERVRTDDVGNCNSGAPVMDRPYS